MLITNLKIAEYLVKKWEFIVAIKKRKKIVRTKMMLEKKMFAETYTFKIMFAEENFSYPPPHPPEK